MSDEARLPLRDFAAVIRSKNAGPFRLTLDILFRRQDEYEHVRDSGEITPETIAGLYLIPLTDITDFVWFDPGKALKATIRRPVSSGAAGDSDVYGAQQHAPLLTLTLPARLAAGPS